MKGEDILTRLPGTLESVLMSKADDEVKSLIREFQHAPWDYRIFGPMSLEATAAINIYLSVGKTKKMYDIVLEFNLETGVVKSLEVNTPKVKTL